MAIDVADEGDVGLIKVVNQNELDKIKSIQTGFGNMDGDSYPFEKSCAAEISEEEIRVLEKFGLTDLQFGYCNLSEDEAEYDEYEDEDEDEDY